MTADLTALPSLEQSLWQADTRHDRQFMQTVLDPDFIEFGRSGRRYGRDEILPAIGEHGSITASLHALDTRRLSPELALVTYVSEVRQGDGDEWANRSSIWDCSSGRWELRFHQGTPCEAPR